ncbi:MAG: hypothetical protein AAGI72_10375 [Pseudomonadota bacterium]
MSSKIVRIAGSESVETDLLVVDYVAGRLEEDELLRFEAQLRNDQALAARVATERALHESIVDSVPVSQPSADAFARLKAQISESESLPEAEDEEPSRSNTSAETRDKRAGSTVVQFPRRKIWKPMAVAASVAAALFLTTTLDGFRQPANNEDREFTTLSSDLTVPVEGAAQYRLVFVPDVTEAERVAGTLAMKIIDGPGPAGAYVVTPSRALSAEALEALRNDPRILFIEPLRYGKTQ